MPHAHVIAPAALRDLPGLHLIRDTHASPAPNASNDPVAGRPCDKTIPLRCPKTGVHVEIARNPAQLAQANALIERQYRRAGFTLQRPPLHDAAEDIVTLLAYLDQRPVATLTLRFDGPRGLLADAHYGDILARYRSPGRLLWETGRLAIDTERPVMEMLTPLLRSGWQIGHAQRGATDLFMECHPRHAAFYQRLAGFRQLGQETLCSRVGAPAVLLHQNSETFDLPGFASRQHLRRLWHEINTHASADPAMLDAMPLRASHV